MQQAAEEAAAVPIVEGKLTATSSVEGLRLLGADGAEVKYTTPLDHTEHSEVGTGGMLAAVAATQMLHRQRQGSLFNRTGSASDAPLPREHAFPRPVLKKDTFEYLPANRVKGRQKTVAFARSFSSSTADDDDIVDDGGVRSHSNDGNSSEGGTTPPPTWPPRQQEQQHQGEDPAVNASWQAPRSVSAPTGVGSGIDVGIRKIRNLGEIGEVDGLRGMNRVTTADSEEFAQRAAAIDATFNNEQQLHLARDRELELERAAATAEFERGIQSAEDVLQRAVYGCVWI